MEVSHDENKTSVHAGVQAEIVCLVRDGGKGIAAVARDLGFESAVRNWVSRSEADAGRGGGKVLSTAEREEISQLRRENRQLRMERDILKKATAFFARESQ